LNDLLDALSELAALAGDGAGDIERSREGPAGDSPPDNRKLIGLTDGKLRANLRAGPWSSPLLPACCSGSTTKRLSRSPNGARSAILVSDCADELDMDIVAYAMSLIMDYGAL